MSDKDKRAYMVTEHLEICGTAEGVAGASRTLAPYEDGWRLVSEGCADGEHVLAYTRTREVSADMRAMELEVSDE
jgi:hypothetical protein